MRRLLPWVVLAGCGGGASPAQMVTVEPQPRLRRAHTIQPHELIHQLLVNSPWALLEVPAHEGRDGFDVCLGDP